MLDHFDFPHQQKDPESAWQQEEREAKILLLIEQTIQRFALNDTNGYSLNPSDKEYYIRRAIRYMDITARLADLDPVRDYSEINGIGHKRQCIRQDFRQLMEKTNKFNKKI